MLLQMLVLGFSELFYSPSDCSSPSYAFLPHSSFYFRDENVPEATAARAARTVDVNCIVIIWVFVVKAMS